MAAAAPPQMTAMPSTASRTTTDTLSTVHTYTLSGFSLIASMGPGTRSCSDFFQVGGHHWRIEVYPAGVNKETEDFVGVFLVSAGGHSLALALHEFAILDQQKTSHIVKARRREDGAVLVRRGVVASYDRFIEKRFLYDHPNHYLKNDQLVIRCCVEVLRSYTSRVSVIPRPSGMGMGMGMGGGGGGLGLMDGPAMGGGGMGDGGYAGQYGMPTPTTTFIPHPHSGLAPPAPSPVDPYAPFNPFPYSAPRAPYAPGVATADLMAMNASAVYPPPPVIASGMYLGGAGGGYVGMGGIGIGMGMGMGMGSSPYFGPLLGRPVL